MFVPTQVDDNCTGTYHAEFTGESSNSKAFGALQPVVTEDGMHHVMCTEDDGIGENNVYNGTIGMNGISANMNRMTNFGKHIHL